MLAKNDRVWIQFDSLTVQEDVVVQVYKRSIKTKRGYTFSLWKDAEYPLHEKVTRYCVSHAKLYPMTPAFHPLYERIVQRRGLLNKLTFSRESLRVAAESAPIEKLQAAAEAIETLFTGEP